MVLHRELHSSAIIRAAEHGETIHPIVGEVESQACVIGKMGIVGKLIGVAVTFDDLIERDARGGRRRCISGYAHASKCVLHRDSLRRQRVDNHRELHDVINFIFWARPEAPSRQFVEP